MPDRILVTGASGFIAAHAILELLDHGYEVRGTLRDLSKAEHIRAVLGQYNHKASTIEFVSATLTDRNCWNAAVHGCDGIFHLASPVPIEQPRDPDELVIPARQGALNVLRAAQLAGIKRVVMTSSVYAVIYHANAESRKQTGNDWTDLSTPGLTPYAISKTVAEQAARDFAETADGIELVTVLPSLVLGPALEPDYGSSLEALLLLLNGSYPLLPKLGFAIVDVRDVASLLRIAYEAPEAAGQRLICSSDFRWFVDISKQLVNEFPDYKKQLPTRQIPNALVKVLARFDKVIAYILSDLDRVIEYDCTPAESLGWRPRSAEEAISAGARSLIELGLV
ncbi:MAG: NAD-dependent epimerase/dehydratase family protein [bacterium]|nr:NAD-dependent epimerase/dehydratase family protein [Gammaproteobacteria bacterium]HIL97875.1 NAD-dependent epimerase/dehydratase family protein [Pseudomonadales bacterium]